MLLGDFNARVGKSDDVDNVIGMFGKISCNSNGNLLITLLWNCNLMICNGRTLLSDPQWTRIQTRLNHKSIIDCWRQNGSERPAVNRRRSRERFPVNPDVVFILWTN